MGSRRIRTAALTVALALTAAAGIASPASAVPELTDDAAKKIVAHSTAEPQAQKGNRLNSGQSISGEDYLQSTSGQHQLWADEDLYVFSGNGAVQYLTGDSILPPGPQNLIMQSDGNLVLYVNNLPYFHTGTFGHAGAFVVMQDDGNVVVYSPQGQPLWASGTMATYGFAMSAGGESFNGFLIPGWYLTSTDGRYKLLMQADGNLVLYFGNRPLWHAGTHGNSGAFFAIQGDGNLVVYSASGRPLWHSITVRTADFFVLELQDDGNLVHNAVTNDRIRVIWQTRTGGSR